MAVIVFVAVISVFFHHTNGVNSHSLFKTSGGFSVKASIEIKQNKILKIGHRGAAGYEPENTIRSFQKAIELGVDMIELDVRICKSGEVVVIHHDRLDATTDGTGFVRDKTLEELKKFDAGKGEKIPTLTEALDSIGKRIIVDIEIKEEGMAQPIAEIIQRYVSEKQWGYNLFIVSSFLFDELDVFKTLMPSVEISVLGNSSHELIRGGQKLSASSLSVHHETITEDFIFETHTQDMKVFVWTVNHEDDIARMKELGVDGIFSDFPNKL